jgi:hypothetical protein
MGRQGVASATTADTVAAERMLRMVAGSCAHPECVLREVVAQGSTVNDRALRPSVLITCTNPSCSAGPSMHDECFTKLQASLVRSMLSTLSSGFKDTYKSDEERHRLIWTSKYDLVRPHCRCACGQGYLRTHWDASAARVVRVGDATPGGSDAAAAEEKREKHEAALRAKAVKEAEIKAREREAKAREREEGRQRNQQRKAEKAREKRDGPRHVLGLEGVAGAWSIGGGFSDDAGNAPTPPPLPSPPPLPALFHAPSGASAHWGGAPPFGALPFGGRSGIGSGHAAGMAAVAGLTGQPSLPFGTPMLPPSAPPVARPASFHLEKEAFPNLAREAVEPGRADLRDLRDLRDRSGAPIGTGASAATAGSASVSQHASAHHGVLSLPHRCERLRRRERP